MTLLSLVPAVLRVALLAVVLQTFSFPLQLAFSGPIAQRLELGLIALGASVLGWLWLAAAPARRRGAGALLAAGALAALAAYAFPSHAELDSVAIPSGAVAVVTGGSKGIGLATALQLRELGFARILVASRSAPPPEAVVLGRLEHVHADLGTLAGADALAAELLERVDRIDVLLLNAGVGLRWAMVETADGLPLLHAVNHVAQVRLLADQRVQSLMHHDKPAPMNRVVFVTSGAQAQVDDAMALRSLTNSVEPHQTYEAYALSKFHQVVFARTLARDGRHFAVSVMPGAVNSQIFGEFAPNERAEMVRSYFPHVRQPTALLRALEYIVEPVATLLRMVRHATWDSVERGAERVLWCALDRRVPSGTFCNNFGDIDTLINPLALNATMVDLITQEALRAARVAGEW